MRKIFVLAKKEFVSCFHSWLGFLLGIFFFLLAGLFFALLVLSYIKISMSSEQLGSAATLGISQTHFIFGSFFLNFSILLVFLVPLLSMRSFAEEKRQETLELLFTYPLSDFEIVAGKFLGLVWVFELLVVPVLGYVAVFRWIGGDFDWGPVLLGFLGFWLLGNAYLAAGLFVSTLTKSQVVSALGTFGLLVIFWILDWVAKINDGMLAKLFSEISPLTHYRNFTMGILDLNDVVYFCFFFAFFIFLSLRSIEARNWKS